MRFICRLPDDLRYALMARASLEGTTLEELVARLLRVALTSSASDGATRVPSLLPVPVRGDRRKIKACSNARLAALADSLTDR